MIAKEFQPNIGQNRKTSKKMARNLAKIYCKPFISARNKMYANKNN